MDIKIRIPYRTSLSLLVIVTAQAINTIQGITASTECVNIIDPNPSDSNGCFYPACETIDNADNSYDSKEHDQPIGDRDDKWTCVSDKSFCSQSNQRFVSTSEVLAAGKICSCKDILNYPTMISACLTNGVYSPIARDDDCVDGTVVCPGDIPNFLVDDTDNEFTACDLKCDFEMGHISMVPDGPYQYGGCSFPKFVWTVASKSEFNALHASDYGIIDDTLYIGGTILSLDRCYSGKNIVPLHNCTSYATTQSIPLHLRQLLKGPFRETDPMSSKGSYVADMSMDIAPSRRCLLAQVNKNSGEPMDLSILETTGNCYIDSLGTGGSYKVNDEKLLIAGGHHTAGGILYANTTGACKAVLENAYTKCESGQTIVKAHDFADTAFVFLMELDGDIRWLIQPWIEVIDRETMGRNSPYHSTFVTGSSIDTHGDVYISGYRDDVAHLESRSMIGKFSGVDGSVIWEKQFPWMQDGISFVHDDLEDVLYMTLIVPSSTVGDVLGITCNPSSSKVKICSVLARISANDGSLHWSRYVYGFSDPNKIYPKPKLAHSDDGPYVYASFSGAGSLGPSNLDRGTSYSGCKDIEGVVTLEFDPVFSDLKLPLNPSICRSRGLGMYFHHAIPVNAVNSRAVCAGNNTNQDCLVKYHKLTGLPIWGSVSPRIEDFQPLADGIIVTGTIYGQSTFNTVEVSVSVNSSYLNHSMVYQSKIDLAGVGLYVQPIISHQSNAFGASLTHDSVTGNVYIGFMTEGSRTDLGSGAPVGFTQDLELVDKSPIARATVAKLGIDEKPHCIISCADDGVLISPRTCFIGHVCYSAGDIGTKVGMPCGMCDPYITQTQWTPRECGDKEKSISIEVVAMFAIAIIMIGLIVFECAATAIMNYNGENDPEFFSEEGHEII